MNSVMKVGAGNLLISPVTHLLKEQPTGLRWRTLRNLQAKTKARPGSGKHTRMQLREKRGGGERSLFCVRAVKPPSADKYMAEPRDAAFSCGHSQPFP